MANGSSQLTCGQLFVEQTEEPGCPFSVAPPRPLPATPIGKLKPEFVRRRDWAAPVEERAGQPLEAVVAERQFQLGVRLAEPTYGRCRPG